MKLFLSISFEIEVAKISPRNNIIMDAFIKRKTILSIFSNPSSYQQTATRRNAKKV
ncbi:hypothetical protein [Flavobacterium algoritolerans]|uniref:Uncharacterized protein n=1 Tax=Flavobacterium algoritolerans TaxID=3041254 RepID=A0ABT6V8I5_9FLAO|nr:hypothetical protein [Flavobacterium algoritolerans]MDI5893287.1 hypothetical protein [Flavobacterium algoritolerans]